MGGGNHCCVVGCSNSNKKTSALFPERLQRVSYFGFPKGPEHAKWRSQLITAVNRCDPSFNPATAHICSIHFERSDLLFRGKGYKLVLGALPSLHMPKKSVETPCLPPRKIPTSRPAPPVPERVTYLSLAEVQRDIERGEIGDWIKLQCNDSVVILGKFDPLTGIVIKTVQIDEQLDITVRFGEVVVRDVLSSVEKIPIEKFLSEIDKLTKCSGIQDASNYNQCSNQWYKYVSTSVLNGKPTIISIIRSKQCTGSIRDAEEGARCPSCTSLLCSLQTNECQSKQSTVHPNTPLSKLSHEILVKEVKAARSDNRKLQKQLQVMTKKMDTTVSDDVGEGLFATLENKPHGNLLMDLFWEEQKKAFNTSPKGMGWHSMMIRFAIYLQYQSSRAYQDLRDTGVLRLPNKSTLRDYTNYIQPKSGFQPHIFEELKNIASKLPPEKKYVALLHDEMKIKADLVYDKRSGNVVGFTNPENWTFIGQDETLQITTYVLVFMVIGINSHIKTTIGHFPTRSATADELFPLLWKSIAYLEMTCKLKNNNKDILWSHVERVYHDDTQGHLYRAKLRYDHVHLTPSSRMSVRLAAKVLSDSVSRVLRGYYDPEMTETATLFSLVDRFFDCLNVRSLREHTQKRKPDLAPYTSMNDTRFHFLRAEFLAYF